MNRIVLMLLVATTCILPNSPNDDDETKQQIESLLKIQDQFWNEGDIDGFMQTYWKSDDLTFSGGGNTTRGWQATLDRYKKSYPRDKMGKLHFDQLETTLLDENVALVLGRWYLDNLGDKKEGNFSLVMKKFDDQWRIVHDHSSTLEKEKGWLSVDQAEQVGKMALQAKSVTNEKHNHFLAVSTSGADKNRTCYVDRKTAEVTWKKPIKTAGHPK